MESFPRHSELGFAPADGGVNTPLARNPIRGQ